MELHIEIILYSTCNDDFLGPCIWTFDDLSPIWIFHLFELRCSCGKMSQNNPKWSKMLKNLPQLSKNTYKVNNITNTKSKNCLSVLFLAILGNLGWFGVILGNIGPLDYFGLFRPFFKYTGLGAPGAQSDEWKLKYDLNNQMSAYMVQENHWKKLITI